MNFVFDPNKGQYSAAVLFMVKIAGVLTLGLLAAAWVGMTWVRRRPNTMPTTNNTN